jgi:hypothetical protein
MDDLVDESIELLVEDAILAAPNLPNQANPPDVENDGDDSSHHSDRLSDSDDSVRTALWGFGEFGQFAFVPRDSDPGSENESVLGGDEFFNHPEPEREPSPKRRQVQVRPGRSDGSRRRSVVDPHPRASHESPRRSRTPPPRVLPTPPGTISQVSVSTTPPRSKRPNGVHGVQVGTTYPRQEGGG